MECLDLTNLSRGLVKLDAATKDLAKDDEIVKAREALESAFKRSFSSCFSSRVLTSELRRSEFRSSLSYLLQHCVCVLSHNERLFGLISETFIRVLFDLFKAESEILKIRCIEMELPYIINKYYINSENIYTRKSAEKILANISEQEK